jgi:hypothetical protein
MLCVVMHVLLSTLFIQMPMLRTAGLPDSLRSLVLTDCSISAVDPWSCFVQPHRHQDHAHRVALGSSYCCLHTEVPGMSC